MGLLNKLLGLGFVDEFKKGKPTVVIRTTGHFVNYNQKITDIAERYGYELVNIAQSRDPNPFALVTDYTLVFRKKRRF